MADRLNISMSYIRLFSKDNGVRDANRLKIVAVRFVEIFL